MLRVVHGSGTYAADIAGSDVFQQIAAWVGPETLREQDYLEVRAIWERGVYELVMKRASSAQLDHLEQLVSAMLSASGSQEAESMHQQFHEALLAATGNDFLATVGTILQRCFWGSGYRDGSVRQSGSCPLTVRSSGCSVPATLLPWTR
jgi:DNA-binding FadR family transcriptional regulator